MNNSGRLRRLAGARALVTGASGFLGSHVVEQLAADGLEVGALSRSRGRLAEIDDSRFTFIPCDLTDAKLTFDAFDGFVPDVVFHFASTPDSRESFEHATTTIRGNISGTLNMLEAARLCGVKTVVYGDSCKVYGGKAAVPYRETTAPEPNSSYAMSKLAGWHMCQLYGRLHDIDTVAVRPTLIYGPRQGTNIISFVIQSVLRGDEQIFLDGGAQTRDPLYISDAVDAFVAAAERAPRISGRVVNVGGGSEIAVEQLARLIVQLSGRSADIVSRPQRARPTEMWRSFCDNAEADAMLSWTPRTSLSHGLQQTLEYLALTYAGAEVTRL